MQTVDITTTQNVTIQYELAGLRERALACILDLAIIWVIAMLIGFLGLLIHSDAGQYLGLFLTIPFIIFYTFLSEQILDGQTIGKRALQIKVVKLDGKPITTADYFLRWTMRLIDIHFSLGLVAGALVSSSAQGQRLGDLATNTSVIKLNSSLRFSLNDILNISSLSDYVPQYNEVRRMNEQDMILIKTTMLRADRYRNDAHENALRELTQKVCKVLDVQEHSVRDARRFLQTVLKDYIVLTR